MSYEQIIFEQTDKVATITLNRPDRLNAYTAQMMAEMQHALTCVENDDNMRVTIVTGAGRGFCAGADLASGGDTFDRAANDEPGEPDEEEHVTGLAFFLNLKKPVIAAVNGPAVGIGVTMILPMDIRIAGESARIGLVFNRRGILPELGCPWILPKIIGLSKAAELMYTGRILNSAEALDYGLVSRVVPDDQLMSTAMELALEIADNCAPVSTALTKVMLWQFLSEPDPLKAEKINDRYFKWIGGKEDAKEGVTSFLEKRQPDWKMKVSNDMPDFFPIV